MRPHANPQEVLKEDIRNLIDQYPAFRDLFWAHGEDDRKKLTKDWVDRYDNEEHDYSGNSKKMREWVESLWDKGVFTKNNNNNNNNEKKEFSIGEEVLCRDTGEQWLQGVIKHTTPLRVKPRGNSANCNWKDATWDEVKKLPYTPGSVVRFRDTTTQNWSRGTVKALNPLRIKPHNGDGAHAYTYVSEIPKMHIYENGEKSIEGPCSICLETGSDTPSHLASCCGKHMFHRKCLEKWFKGTPECPSCRAVGLQEEDIVAEKEEEEEEEDCIPATTRNSGTLYRHTDANCDGTSFLTHIDSPAGTPPFAVHVDDVVSPLCPPRLGVTLEIFGLKSESKLNGEKGICVGFLERRAVVLLKETDVRVALKLVNVRLV